MKRGWTQAEAARQLGVSQGYVSLMETGKRRVPEKLVPALRGAFALPPTALPPREANPTSDRLPRALSALGYGPFSYLKGAVLNPAEVLLATLRKGDAPTRVVEGLPWLVLHHPNLDWNWLLERAKAHDVQNRLAHVLTLARKLAEDHQDARLARRLGELLQRLERSRLAREDTLCNDSMTEAERTWLRMHRPNRSSGR